MSTVSELFPAGGGDNTIDMVASGTLPNGSPVILKADGTVEVVELSGPVQAVPSGAIVKFNTDTTATTSVSFDPNTSGKFVVVYRDAGNSSYGTAIVGTVSGTSITFGSAVVYDTWYAADQVVTFDPNVANKLIVAYRGNNNYGYCIVGTVSGTSLSFGTTTAFNSAVVEYPSITPSPNTSGKFIVAYANNNGADHRAVVASISGTSVSFGSSTVFNSGGGYHTGVAFDTTTSDKFVVAYRDKGNSQYGTAVVGTLSGTSVSFGSEYVFNSATSAYVDVAFVPDNANKFVIAYQDQGNSWYATAIVCTVSGTSVSYGASTVVDSTSDANYTRIAFDTSIANKFGVVYQAGALSQYGTITLGTVSGTSLSFESSIAFNTDSTADIGISFDPTSTGRFILSWAAWSDGGKAAIGQLDASSTNLTSTNLLGISQKAVADGETTSVETLGGLSAVHSGLTIGSDYYVATDGTLTTTATDNVSLGRAVSATTINMRNYI